MWDWIKALGDLPASIAVLVVFTVCLIGILRAVFRRVVDPMMKSHEETADAIRKGLDANTEAVKRSVEHTEKIVENHLSHNGDLWAEVKHEMHSMTESIDAMNNRNRKYDKEK